MKHAMGRSCCGGPVPAEGSYWLKATRRERGCQSQAMGCTRLDLSPTVHTRACTPAIAKHTPPLASCNQQSTKQGCALTRAEIEGNCLAFTPCSSGAADGFCKVGVQVPLHVSPVAFHHCPLMYICVNKRPWKLVFPHCWVNPGSHCFAL